MTTATNTYVVAGNGHSLCGIEPGRVLESDVIVRTNNFFFEPEFYLGRRVDYAFMGGDPRVAPFMFETLYQCRKQYELKAWSSHDPRVVVSGKRRFAGSFVARPALAPKLQSRVDAALERFGKQPTTGVQAALFACGLGAKSIILAGFDLYSGARRYPFEPGRHYRDLMGKDLASRQMDARLHDAALDRELLSIVAETGLVEITCATQNSALSDLFPVAPKRGETGLCLPRANPPDDWVSWAGAYPIGLLKVLRSGSRVIRRLGGRRA